MPSLDNVKVEDPVLYDYIMKIRPSSHKIYIGYHALSACPFSSVVEHLTCTFTRHQKVRRSIRRMGFVLQIGTKVLHHGSL
jgi:hypothetical protein